MFTDVPPDSHAITVQAATKDHDIVAVAGTMRIHVNKSRLADEPLGGECFLHRMQEQEGNLSPRICIGGTHLFVGLDQDCRACTSAPGLDIQKA